MKKCVLYVLSLILFRSCHGDNESWFNYMEQKQNYIGHFGEMLRRKNEQYYQKREEYSNWMLNYREMEKENHHDHTESNDEEKELHHEHAEVGREQNHEHHHHHGGGLRKRRSAHKDMHDIFANPKDALNFFKRKRFS